MTGADSLDSLNSLDALDTAYLSNLLEADDQFVYFKDCAGRFLRASRGQAERLGVADEAALLGLTDFDFFPVEHAAAAYEDEQRIIRTGQPLIEKEEHLRLPGGEQVWVLASKHPLRDASGAVIGTFGMSRDITARKLLEQREHERTAELARAYAEIERVQRQQQTVLDMSPDFLMRLDSELRFTYVNPAAAALSQLAPSDMLGRTLRELRTYRNDINSWEETLRQAFRTGLCSEFEHLYGDGTDALFLHSRVVPELDADGTVVAVLVVSRDLTARKRAEDALADRVVRDPLTGLANRVLLDDRIAHAVTRLERNPGRLAVLFLDLDRFKVINDSLGHRAGDALLTEVADRLRASSRASDTIARFGGDEFVVLCENVGDNDNVAAIAQRILRALDEPMRFEGEQIHVGASIGIAITGDAGATAEELIRDADAAMYLAKGQSGAERYQFFDAEVRALAVSRLSIENDLRVALADGQFRLLYQPLQALTTRRLVGVEALLRWEHPTRGLIAPADFLPVAEDSRLIVPIGQWVLDEACRQLAEWNFRRTEPLSMSVNVSAHQLADPQFPTHVADALRAHDVRPGDLCLEVTETAVIDHAHVAEAALARLSALGVQIALDDFGTGYSSLGHLRRLPIHVLKIDRAFVDGLDRGARDSAIVAAVTALARALGMTTVGEGIESEEQLAELQRLGCDNGQGYLLDRPLTVEQVAASYLVDRSPGS